MKIKDIAKAMKEIDFCMMTTVDERGTLYSRPMSNNSQVEFNGDTYFFTLEETEKRHNIKQNPRVSLTYQGNDNLFIQVFGEASLEQEKEKMKQYWNKDLNAWFKDGINTDGLCMIHVKAKWVEFWKNELNERINLSK